MTILNTTEVVFEETAGWSWLGLICGILMIVLFGFGIVLDSPADVFCLLGAACVGALVFFLFDTSGEPIMVNQYEVTCEDDYAYPQDYVEHHRFIEKRGDIWVWQDIEPIKEED